jgi:hypothetical protein
LARSTSPLASPPYRWSRLLVSNASCGGRLRESVSNDGLNTHRAQASNIRPPAPVDGLRLAPAEERSCSKPPLLLPKTDAVVTGAFNQLATTMLCSGRARTLDDLVEDMLRPMLVSWLDVYLPPLVEKLMWEEIERRSRKSAARGFCSSLRSAGPWTGMMAGRSQSTRGERRFVGSSQSHLGRGCRCARE